MLRNYVLRLFALLITLLATGCTGSADPTPGAVTAPDVTIATGPAANGDAFAVDPQLLADLQAELRRVLAARGITLDADGRPVGKSVSTLPRREYIFPPTTNDVPNDLVLLEWRHYMLGDYDLNGEVNVSDLTPVGVHFGKDTNSLDWADASVADGDDNGEVNFADVTPIGQNFGALLSGYVVEYLNYFSDDWTDFGFAPFDPATSQATSGQMIYEAHRALDAKDFRVAPVGETREFSWTNYRLDTWDSSCYPAVLANNFGTPGIAFVDQAEGQLYYGYGKVSHPQEAADWSLMTVTLTDVKPQPPGLAFVLGKPMIAYVRESQTFAFDLNFASADNADPQQATWQNHVVETSLPSSPPGFLLQDSKPVIGYADGGTLFIYRGTTMFPSQPADWQKVAAMSDVHSPSLTLVGRTLNIASFKPGLPAQLHFTRALTENPAGPLDFFGYQIAETISSAYTPSIYSVNGLPCIVHDSEANSAVEFLFPSDSVPDNSGDWSSHAVFADPVDRSNPRLCLLDGRPAAIFGRFGMHFAWSRAAAPAATGDWDLTMDINGEVNFNPYPPSIIVIDGLPIVTYTMYDPPNSARHVYIAVASEKQ
jgi:hypothetical protein